MRQRKFESDTASLRLRLLQAGHSTCRHDGTAVILDFRPKLANRCSQEAKTRAIRASIPDFKPRLENRCRQKVKTRAIRASIPDFKPRLANRCSQKAKTGANRASILDFKPRLGNRCSQKVKSGAIRASIPDFKPRLANRCSKEVKTRAIRASILDFKPRLANRCSPGAYPGAIPPAQGLKHYHAPGNAGWADSDAETHSTRHKKKSPDSSLNRDSRSAAATYSPTWCSSTIGASELNFSVRDGKRWILTAITAAI